MGALIIRKPLSYQFEYEFSPTYSERRTFLQQLAAGVACAHFCHARTPRPSAEWQNAACQLYAAGMALNDLKAIAKHPAVEIVAVSGCHDLNRTADFRKLFPAARVYQDFRELLEKERDLQTVNVSTPDHMHARIGLAALAGRGLHVYGQKPLHARPRGGAPDDGIRAGKEGRDPDGHPNPQRQ